MTPSEAIAYLNSFVNYESQRKVPYTLFKLDRVSKLLDFLGNPHQKIKAIHVAGSKGKGSTCAFVAQILKEAGYRVGLYTSPHLQDFKERIRILSLTQDRLPAAGEIFPDTISEEDLCLCLGQMKPMLEKFQNDGELFLTYFEVLTALAFHYFSKRNVDYMVLETGMGGRLDATNVVDAQVCGLTPISLEHTAYLGSTLAEIASEKIAIVKRPGQPVVMAPQPDEALKVMRQWCKEKKAPVHFIGRDILYQGIDQSPERQTFLVRGRFRPYPVTTALLGRHQMMNAAVAVGLAEVLIDQGADIRPHHIRQGIQKTFWPGRFELMQRNPTVILDSAHNPTSARLLAETVQQVFPGKKVLLILGISDDKDKMGICQALRFICHQTIFTKADNPRAYDFKDQDAADGGITVPWQKMDSVPQAVQYALDTSAGDEIILITGSIFVVGEAREELKKTQGHNVTKAQGGKSISL